MLVKFDNCRVSQLPNDKLAQENWFFRLDVYNLTKVTNPIVMFFFLFAIVMFLILTKLYYLYWILNMVWFFAAFSNKVHISSVYGLIFREKEFELLTSQKKKNLETFFLTEKNLNLIIKSNHSKIYANSWYFILSIKMWKLYICKKKKLFPKIIFFLFCSFPPA